MKCCMLMVLAAGTATVAMGQEQIWSGADLTAVRVPSSDPGYGSRMAPMWSNGRFPGVNVAFLGGLYDYLDDVSFVGTPWEGATGRVISQIKLGLGQFAAGQTADIRAEFYNASLIDGLDGGFTNPVDMLAGQAPFATSTFLFPNTGIGIYSWATADVDASVPDGIDRIYVRISVLNPGTDTIWTGVTNAVIIGSANDLTVGQGSPSVGWKVSNFARIPAFIGGPAGTNDHRRITSGPAANGPGVYMELIGEAILADPPGTIDLSAGGTSCLPDAGLTLNPVLGAGGVQFYRVCLGGDATDAMNQFLDIDSIGGTQSSVAIWSRPSGTLIASDHGDGGNGGTGLLSFGIGRRAGTGDSTQFDGRDGELRSGEYIVAVASGAAGFASSYAVSAAGPGGTAALRLRTNVNGTPAAPSVPPMLQGTAFDLGDISRLASNPPTADMEQGWVVWYRWDNCSEIVDDGDAGVTGTYLDFSFDQSSAGSDPQAIVFDGTGAAVYSADNEGPGAFPQFSWGDVAPARPAISNGAAFAGQNGALPAGEYHMAVGLSRVVASNEPRWHARSDSSARFPAEFTPYFANLSSCGGCPVCAADFNEDGGVDGADVEAFYVTWETGEQCGDVNGDGGVDGGDLETFFILWEGGGC